MEVIIPAEPEPIEIDTRRTAVIVVDMQNGFCSKGEFLDTFGRLNEAQFGLVIQAALRGLGFPIT